MNEPITPASALPSLPDALKSVYLSGAISGLTYRESQRWREHVTRALAPDIACYSPLRAHAHLAEVGTLHGSYESHVLTTAAALTARDRHDCLTCDLLLVNLIGASEVSIGTCIELGWADAFRKPVVLVMEDKHNLHDHPLVRGICAFHVSDLEEGIEAVRSILLP